MNNLPSSAEKVPANSSYYDLQGKQVVAGAEVMPDGRIEKVTEPVVRLLPTSHPSPRGWFMLFPGGGYIRLSAVKEGTQTAAFLIEQGYHVAMLEYRVNQGRETRKMALQDALAAWLMVQEKAGAFGFASPGGNTLSGMIGYSAGGHLAARATMHLSAELRPDPLVLLYPAYLDQKKSDGHEPVVTSPEETAARLFISFAANDKAHWVAGAKVYAEAWKAAGGRVEFHEFEKGGHGFGLTDTSNPAVVGTQQALIPFLTP